MTLAVLIFLKGFGPSFVHIDWLKITKKSGNNVPDEKKVGAGKEIK